MCKFDYIFFIFIFNLRNGGGGEGYRETSSTTAGAELSQMSMKRADDCKCNLLLFISFSMEKCKTSNPNRRIGSASVVKPLSRHFNSTFSKMHVNKPIVQ